MGFSDGSSASLASDNVLSYGSATFLRAASPSGVLKGMVFDQSRLPAARALTGGAGLGRVSLTLVNVLNEAQRIAATTESDGSFTTPADSPDRKSTRLNSSHRL